MKSSKALIFVALILAAVLLLGIGFAVGRKRFRPVCQMQRTRYAVRTVPLRKSCGIWAAPRFWTIFQRQEGLRNQMVYRQPSLSMFP